LSFNDDYFAKQEKSARKQAELWLKKMSAQVPLEYVIDSAKLGFLSGDQILAMAKRKGIGLVAISSRSSSMERFFFGSAAYELFRRKSLPVVVFGPKF
jgi:nucleotide-binding universal stress UspA family protein